MKESNFNSSGGYVLTPEFARLSPQNISYKYLGTISTHAINTYSKC